MQAVGVLVDAVQNQFVKPWRLKAACAVLKMVGADRAETMPATTAQEVHVRLQEREAELREHQGKLKASEVDHSRSISAADDSEAAIAAPVLTEARRTESGGSGESHRCRSLNEGLRCVVPKGMNPRPIDGLTQYR